VSFGERERREGLHGDSSAVGDRAVLAEKRIEFMLVIIKKKMHLGRQLRDLEKERGLSGQGSRSGRASDNCQEKGR